MHINITHRYDYPDRIALHVEGGENALHPNWSEYFLELSKFVDRLKDEFKTEDIIVSDLENDVLDDVFYANIIILKKVWE